MRTISQVCLTTTTVTVNGTRIETTQQGAQLLREVYKRYLAPYPKFFKMDSLCRLGYVASELLLQHEQPRHRDCDDRAVILFNTSGSLANDREYQHTIQDTDNYYPSPAVFVYTLPNIVTGEIAIANKLYAETAFYLLPHDDIDTIHGIVQDALDATPGLNSVITGWVECSSPDDFNARLELITRE